MLCGIKFIKIDETNSTIVNYITSEIKSISSNHSGQFLELTNYIGN